LIVLLFFDWTVNQLDSSLIPLRIIVKKKVKFFKNILGRNYFFGKISVLGKHILRMSSNKSPLSPYL